MIETETLFPWTLGEVPAIEICAHCLTSMHALRRLSCTLQAAPAPWSRYGAIFQQHVTDKTLRIHMVEAGL